MTLEEIVKQEGRQPDCSGYVTKYDIECSDGLTIRQGAFNDDNGRRVPMVWMHDHKDMENVLGHIYLESRDDGVYGYGFFNDSPKGQLGKLYVDHGDISSFSIYANKLKKKARDVVHGMIREVSLVLAGANRGAIIDSPISHSDQDEDEGEGVICMGDDYGGPIYGNDEPLSVEEYLEHYGRKGMKWGKNLFKTEYEAHPREKGEEEEETDGKKNKAQEDKEIREKSTKDVNDTVGIAKAESEFKQNISGELTMDDILEHAENEGGKTVLEVFNTLNDEQQSLVIYFLKKARQLIDDGEIKHSEKEEDEMKHNVFDDAKETKENTLSHADMEKLEADVFKDAKSKGSLKDAFLAHADDYGIDNIEWLFPEDRNLNNPPAWIKRPDGWVSKVMKGVHHSPFSRIKSVFADITEPDARARGYMKGNRKVEEVFGLLKRSTSPTTVYKKQKLDRDDIIDITDFDVVSWLKTEMRGMLDEELARAFLVSDGRSPASNDKINEQNIRPIWTDDDLFVIRKAIAVTSSTTTDEKCKQFIRSAIKARKDYKGSGNPTLFTTDDLVSDLMLMEDQIGHPLYETMEKLTAKLRVKEIVTVPVMENLTRISGSMTFELMGIIVNLDDYNVGADKGGSVAMFEDFDIDYNQEKYLIETRCSGALTKPYSAIVIESTSSIYLDVDPDDPSETRYGKSVSDLQSDIVVNDDSISGTLNYVTGYTGYSGDTDLQSGYYIALKLNVPNGATTTIAALNNGGSGTPVDLGSDDYAVGRITTKNAKIVISTTLAGVTVSKTYSLRLLKFGPKS